MGEFLATISLMVWAFPSSATPNFPNVASAFFHTFSERRGFVNAWLKASLATNFVIAYDESEHKKR